MHISTSCICEQYVACAYACCWLGNFYLKFPLSLSWQGVGGCNAMLGMSQQADVFILRFL